MSQTMSDVAAQKVVGDYWSARKRTTGNWWINRMVVRDINRRVSGIAHAEVSRGATDLGRELLAGRRPRLGLSVGCGNGAKEIALIRGDFVERMVCYDLAESRIVEARRMASELGISERIEFHTKDAFKLHDGPEFDFVYWNNALHHMFDVPGTLAWSRGLLRQGGLLLVDEYVGPSRMQFDDETIAYANAIRGLLPKRLLVGGKPGTFHDRSLSREWFEARIAKDPSEAVDSGRTLSAIRELFDRPVVRPTGGTIYYIALNSLFRNFDMAAAEDQEMLKQLLILDEIYTAARPENTIYAVAAALA